MTMIALKWGDIDAWQAAYQKCVTLRTQINEKLVSGDDTAEEFNRYHVIPLGQVVNTAIEDNPGNPESEKEIAREIVKVLFGSVV